MRIGIVCYPTFGGSGVLATELGKALAQQGHHVHFITYQQPVRLNGFIPNIFYHEVQVPTYPLFDYPPYETALASTMVDVIKNNNLQLLHVHYAIPHASAAYMAKKILEAEGLHIPVITTLHGTDITLVGRDKTYAPVVTFSINQSDAITAVSQNLRDETFKHFKIEKNIEVIHNFVDVARFNRKPIDAFKKVIAPEGERILLHASNFRKIKRVTDVVEIFYNVHKKIPSKLLFVGDGPERATAEQLCRQLKVCDDVRFVGKQEQMEDILAIADLFLLTSEYESFGLAALEAMAAGIPVVSTNAGGLPEIMVQGIVGYMGDVGDVETLSHYAIDILQNDERLQQFKSAAAKHAQAFDIKSIVPLYEKLYEEVLSSELVNT
ncbi:N-acetyl-alpha-D-glucosaminyl L-malate synthase BshA [Flavisolibacter ginsenosidimutans]|uniref:N-acetyl-alpha-D-glucosaminyl L-malate synthase BshA n=1 Tax=Flavisolibacter ginsenosidimutans TaxID=661481 RepID=A0A5B8UIN7_9BACT|nr:N-acetyl-alpha-D-glucosaminyl L-malate synthase BshA [Flavisolibacter ginsenosidimutans]QEC55865.1 N-acetyl-alpha-D-glucosaminyl L-malate synthase BshA [Flavisolibacter ginsenosidimutans]